MINSMVSFWYALQPQITDTSSPDPNITLMLPESLVSLWIRISKPYSTSSATMGQPNTMTGQSFGKIGSPRTVV